MEKREDSKQSIKNTMEIILHAGDAREYISKALDEVADYNYDLAKSEMNKANKELIIAHRLQTNKIQEEAEGKHIEYSVLFSHAQDTLMTINSEYNITNHLIKVFEKRDLMNRGNKNGH
ncbi:MULTISPECIES: PTS lactose/cellobiose transporter subunit IIA [unclassified Lactobacillus]|uniref:PTS lactose/cellobiose transporter subunit IIA n=1 Tax=unclassified Lactobacillus TaxID=2620435 RepID=UPI002269CDE9|nr:MULTISPECIES: PTS lactose/cellobiose transporter subunit IIA [unclassified Lactobacillus]MCX8721368.1 PTS lactose/cellobiose transporter subunit IIA [Lactobacillus sp. B4010]MCX8732979.1 PTS lactose/cellobiose transporter subunit IIA [Lactobacillus sp. B4015]MCX8735675.1 PTS lactose/cellobiose transporter subunit IIA [Lactobacillus sp. B4012]